MVGISHLQGWLTRLITGLPMEPSCYAWYFQGVPTKLPLMV